MFEKQDKINTAINLEPDTQIDDPEVPPIQDDEDTGFDHTITQEDLDMNPGLDEEVEVGEVVKIPYESEIVTKEINGKVYRELTNSDGTTYLELIK